MKVFGSTGLSVGELPRLTAEALDGRGPSPVRLPPPLAEELRGYAARQGITAGPVFRSRNGQPMRRTQVTGEIRSLCRDAGCRRKKGTHAVCAGCGRRPRMPSGSVWTSWWSRPSTR